MIGIINVLAALAQRTRLDVLTLLSRGPADGQTSGDLAIQARVPANSMSTHLSILSAAGLVSATRSGRQVVYRIETEAIGSAFEILAARLIGEPTRHDFRSAPADTVTSPVSDAYPRSQQTLPGTTPARWPCNVVVRERVDDRCGEGPHGPSGTIVQMLRGSAQGPR